jgi:hypothetical protein
MTSELPAIDCVLQPLKKEFRGLARATYMLDGFSENSSLRLRGRGEKLSKVSTSGVGE